MRRILLPLLVTVMLLLGCTAPGPAYSGSTTVQASPGPLRIVAGSEVKILEDAGIFAAFTKATGIQLSVAYKGSVDIRNQVMRYTVSNPKDVDVFWAASPIWLPGSLVQNKTSVFRTYVVFAVDPFLGDDLKWDIQKGISTANIVSAIRADKLKLAMPSASQDDAGAMFYMATLSALKGGSGVVQKNDLTDPAIIEAIKAIYGAVDGSAGTTALLAQKVIENRQSYNAVIMPEASIIGVNKTLAERGLPPFTVFYIQDATAVEFFPLGYVNNGVPVKLEQFSQLTAYLKSQSVQSQLLAHGWRTSPIGMAIANPDPTVFNPAWGIDTKTDFLSVTLPKEPVITEALNIYQSAFRKPSFTVYCLDFSGSMAGTGERQLKDAMDLLLDQNRAAQVLLQATGQDKIIVLGFNHNVWEVGQVVGNDYNTLKALSSTIAKTPANGNTAMFSATGTALDLINKSWDPHYNYSIIVLTDGQSNSGWDSAAFRSFYQSTSRNVPVYGILFGAADNRQLSDLAVTSGGAVFDGRKDLSLAFRQAKGNN